MKPAGEPFLDELDARHVVPGQRLRVFRPVGQRHGRIEADEVDPALGEAAEHGRVRRREPLEPPRKPWTCSGLPFGR